MGFTPQFKPEELYISPFISRRVYDEDGNISYQPLERNLNPTGIHLLDEFLLEITAGLDSQATFCHWRGISSAHLSGFVQLLTGLSAKELRLTLALLLADDLLRYTSLTLAQIAIRIGLGTTVNLCYLFQSRYGSTPLDRKRSLRKGGDVGKFRLK